MVFKKEAFGIPAILFQKPSKQCLLGFFFFCEQDSRMQMVYLLTQQLLDTSIFKAHMWCNKSWNFNRKKRIL